MEDVIGDRADAVYVRPVLTVMLRTAIHDFSRYYDARHATIAPVGARDPLGHGDQILALRGPANGNKLADPDPRK